MIQRKIHGISQAAAQNFAENLRGKFGDVYRSYMWSMNFRYTNVYHILIIIIVYMCIYEYSYVCIRLYEFHGCKCLSRVQSLLHVYVYTNVYHKIIIITVRIYVALISAEW